MLTAVAQTQARTHKMVLLCCTLLLLFEFGTPYCPMRNLGLKSRKSERRKCINEATKNNVGAGIARNVRGKCRYREDTKSKFYYEISWDPPLPSATPVSEYTVRIVYHSETYFCFRVPPSQRRIVFNESLGLQYKCWFTFSVTAQPVLFVDGTYKDMERIYARCPVALQLTPLPNILAHRGSNVSFTAGFFEEPTPYPKIRWYFSDDKINCQNRHLINDTERHLLFSANRLVLTIVNVTEKHRGCYTVHAESPGDGRVNEQRGYIDLDITNSVVSYLRDRGSPISDIEKPFFASLAGLMVLLTLVLIITIYTRKHVHKRNIKDSNNTDLLLRKRLYFSHCMHTPSEKMILARFAGAIKSFGVDVILDICSEVEISSAGGMAQWVPSNIEIADKVLIVLTPRYLLALQSNTIDPACDDGDFIADVCKVHSETNYVNNIIYNSSFSPENVMSIRKEVEVTELPSILESYHSLEFPNRFERKDESFRAVIEVLLNDY